MLHETALFGRSILLCAAFALLTTGCDGGGGASAGGPDGAAMDTAAPLDGAVADAGGGADGAGADGAGADVPAGGGTFATCIPPRAADFLLQTLELATEDGGTRVRLQVEPGEGNTVGETFAFHLFGFALERDGALVCVVDPAALGYVWGHHNWDETATATAGGVTFTVTMKFEFVEDGGDFLPRWTDRIVARDENGAVLWGPIDLPVNRCQSEGSGALNGCFQREKAEL